MMNNNVSFTSTFNIVNKCKTYDMFGKEILCSPVEESIKSANEFYTWGIRTCTGGGIVDTKSKKAVGFHCLDCTENAKNIISYINRLFQIVPNPDRAFLIGGKTLKGAEHSMEQFNEFEKVFTDRIPNVSLFKEHVLPYSESDIHYSLAKDTWTIHGMYKPLTDWREFDVLSVDDLKKNYKKIHIANGDVLQIMGKEVEQPIG